MFTPEKLAEYLAKTFYDANPEAASGLDALAPKQHRCKGGENVLVYKYQVRWNPEFLKSNDDLASESPILVVNDSVLGTSAVALPERFIFGAERRAAHGLIDNLCSAADCKGGGNCAIRNAVQRKNSSQSQD